MGSKKLAKSTGVPAAGGVYGYFCVTQPAPLTVQNGVAKPDCRKPESHRPLDRLVQTAEQASSGASVLPQRCCNRCPSQSEPSTSSWGSMQTQCAEQNCCSAFYSPPK